MSIRSPWVLTSIFVFLHHKKKEKQQQQQQLHMCQSLAANCWEKNSFLLNTALWNERKHCLTEAEAFSHLCLYYCEINYVGSFESY